LSSSDLPVAGTRRWRLDLAYDGSYFHGFAYQPEGPTVVGLLRSSLAIVARLDDEPFLVGAGRTDAGVHALAQVVHVDLPDSLTDGEGLVKSLNGLMRGQIRVLKAQVVPGEFNARYSAEWRAYRYLVLETPRPASPALEALAWIVEGPLDMAAMNRAGQAAVGEHDFRAFCKRAPDKGPDDPIKRLVYEIEWRREPDRWGLLTTGEALVLNIRAQSFCHNMVRTLTSAMVAVGQGALPEGEIATRLASFSRDHLPAPAPAAGLALIAVGYPGFVGGPAGFLR
jgi:tRNA pseudouridine38-40 synthase